MHKSLSLLLVSGMAVIVFATETKAAPGMTQGFFIGAGGSWNTLDEDFHSILFTSMGKSARDHYNASANRLAPLLQAGYWTPFCGEWVWGIAAQWKYPGYKTADVNTSRGQYIPNASFSSINIFGPMIERDFSSKTRINNEVSILLYAGMQVERGYFYLGLGPAFFTASNSIYVTSVHTPNGVGSNLVSTSVTGSRTIWAGAIQLGYDYFLNPASFLSFSYTYVQSGKYSFGNSVNAAILNGAVHPGPSTLTLNRAISFSAQEFTLSVNKVF